jgi:glycosyltransferase involved in cell wall biosynthesis
MRPVKVAYLVSHPIQYQAPMLRYLAACPEIDLTTLFISDFSTREYADAGFGARVQWDVPLLGGYKHVFLPSVGGRGQVSSFRPFVYGLARHLKAGRFDALWLHGYAHPANLRALILARQLGMKVLVRAETHARCALGSGWKRRAKEAMVRRLFRMVDAFLAVGALNREYYRSFCVPEERTFLMPYAVDNAFFQSAVSAARRERTELIREVGLNPSRPVILYASRLVGRKRADDLIAAYAALSPDGRREPDPYLILVGEGEERASLEQMARSYGWNSIKFVGFKNQTELPRYFDLCDLFVLVSEREAWGLVVNEVMNAGKPVVLSSDVGAAADLVREGRNGFVVPVHDRPALASRLAVLTSSRLAMEEMGMRSRQIIDRWSYREDAEALMNALDYVMSGARRCA